MFKVIRECLDYSGGTVCTLRLRPLSLWHSFRLRAEGNPYLCGGPVEPDHMARLLYICERARAEYLAGERNGGWRYRYQHRVCLAECYLKGLPNAHASIRTYVREAFTFPEHWKPMDPARAPRQLRAPDELHMLHMLWREWGIHQDTAWDMSLREVRVLQDVVNESDGDESLISERELAAIEEAKAS